eukprot:4359934-Karenia_brevis.AAC.1
MSMPETHFDTSEDEADKRQMRVKQREATESSSSTSTLEERPPVGAPRHYKEEIKDEDEVHMDDQDF